MSHYITRRKRRQRWEAETRNLIKTLQSNRELRYELGLLRSAGYQRAPIRWHGPDLHDSTYPIALTDTGVSDLRLEQIAGTSELDPDLINRCIAGRDHILTHLKRQVTQDIVKVMEARNAIQQYTQQQGGTYPKYRIMWSCWVGVPA